MQRLAHWPVTSPDPGLKGASKFIQEMVEKKKIVVLSKNQLGQYC